MGFSPQHSLGDGILVGAGKGSEYQFAGVGLAIVDLHTGDLLIYFFDSRQVREVQFGIYAVGEHIQSQGNDVYVAGSFSVAEEGTFHKVCSGQEGQFGVSYTCSPVIMRVERENNMVPVF